MLQIGGIEKQPCPGQYYFAFTGVVFIPRADIGLLFIRCAAWKRFEKKWSADCPDVVKSLNEGGDELLTFFKYPESMWKALRTTNCIEGLNGEFRRRVKTQGSLPNTDAGLKLLFGLFACGLISMQRIHGWRDLPAAVAQKRAQMGLIKTSDNVNKSGDSKGLDKAA